MENEINFNYLNRYKEVFSFEKEGEKLVDYLEVLLMLYSVVPAEMLRETPEWFEMN